MLLLIIDCGALLSELRGDLCERTENRRGGSGKLQTPKCKFDGRAANLLGLSRQDFKEGSNKREWGWGGGGGGGECC